MKSSVLSFLIAAVVATTVSATPAIANDNAEKPVELEYIKSAKTELPIYQLRLNNLTKGTYAVAIKDETGDVLYNETLSGSKIVRNYQFDTALPASVKLTFEVSNVKNNSVKVYSVSKSSKTVEVVIVHEVK
ncbi:hypothetical protein [Niabella drilacis]|uniref:Uncharacterized protein n=1 Tax=Niabella drilacis (strain DSM 25811 / CCM 8410 / CCUG 62505 / LMG 26954 / E90) TaxID=1285928 RepID=A0A1G6ZYJ3_NIADE|nr:hypothetical protein [Niabella drilacis]SDE07642.1 hypothetical protein SAMN04487894_12015 [Niabella drilacis]